MSDPHEERLRQWCLEARIRFLQSQLRDAEKELRELKRPHYVDARKVIAELDERERVRRATKKPQHDETVLVIDAGPLELSGVTYEIVK